MNHARKFLPGFRGTDIRCGIESQNVGNPSEGLTLVAVELGVETAIHDVGPEHQPNS